MVESGQASIRPLAYASQQHPGLPVEVVERAELIARLGPDWFAVPERPSFHMLLLARSGEGAHGVDFVDIPVRAGRFVQIRPGQVQRYDTCSDFDASLVLSRTVSASAAQWFPGASACCDLGPVAVETAESIVGSLRREQATFSDDAPTRRLMAALFDALLALFDQAAAPAESDAPPDAYVAFRAAIENNLDRRRSVSDYARELGYSARTISRACQQVTGQSAKDVLTERVALEAKRLLAHTNAPAASISAKLGFSQPTNFHRFFTRRVGQTPGQFREEHR